MLIITSGSRLTEQQNENVRLNAIVEAARKLWGHDFFGLGIAANTAALSACDEIQHTDLPRKVDVFFRHHIPLRSESVAFLVEMYRRWSDGITQNENQKR
jgi:hypothetical protein